MDEGIKRVEARLHGLDLFGEPVGRRLTGPLALQFGVPPFSVLDARAGDWQARKRAWVAIGLKGEEGRGVSPGGASMLSASYSRDRVRGDGRGRAVLSEEGGGADTGAQSTSIFDPVLCECVYRWFCPPGGQVVDPFCGGPVRGVVAGLLGARYWGCDLRQEQVDANYGQARLLCPECLAGGAASAEPQQAAGRVTISKKTAQLMFQGCTVPYIEGVCRGRCCWVQPGGAASVHTTVYVLDEEQRHYLEGLGARFTAEMAMEPRADGKCRFQAKNGLCALHGQSSLSGGKPVKPLSCLVSPWTLTKTGGGLMVRNRYRTLRCYRAEGSIPAYRAFRSGLEVLFGAEEAGRIVAHFDAGGGDYTAQLLPIGAMLINHVQLSWHEEAKPLVELESVDGVLVCRDDLTCGGLGAKGAAIEAMLAAAQGVQGIVTAGSRHSVQIMVAAVVAKRVGLHCRVHIPSGAETPEVAFVRALGAEVVQHSPDPGCLPMVDSWVREDVDVLRGLALLLPPGLTTATAVAATRRRAELVLRRSTPRGRRPSPERIVVVGGSGTTAAGLLLATAGQRTKVLVVKVGANCERAVSLLAGAEAARAEFVTAVLPYSEAAQVCSLGSIGLDRYYEAKALEYLRAGDLFWLSGNRAAVQAAAEGDGAAAIGAAGQQRRLEWVCADARDGVKSAPRADLIFSCPPYGGLERYSGDSRDLSAMDKAGFAAAYNSIIAAAVSRLKEDRFAVWVVGDYRREDGYYSDFVSSTVAAFRAAGAPLYNEAVLVTAVASASLRAARQFSASRNLVKTHQNVLVFCKGDWRRAVAACKTP